MSMIEKAARALCRASLLREPPYTLPGAEGALDRAVDSRWDLFIPDVREVLLAVREVDNATLSANTPLGPMHRYGQWQAMIDAMLKDDQ